MSYKALWLLIAIFGLLLVAGLVILGIDLRRAAKTGPRWKRRLLGAALVLLAALGFYGCGTAAKTGEDPVTAASPAQSEEPGDWEIVTAAWKLAKPLATSGQSTTAERRAADEKLAAAKAAIGRLVQAEELSGAEAELLRVEAADIREDIYRDPPTDSRKTCYEIAYLPSARRSLGRLAKRLPLLEKLATGGKLNLAACEKIIAAAETDLVILASEKELTRAQLSAGERARIVKTRAAVKSSLQRLRSKLYLPLEPMCYYPPDLDLPPPEPQSLRALEERLVRLDTLERESRLAPEVAARVRASIAREREERRA